MCPDLQLHHIVLHMWSINVPQTNTQQQASDQNWDLMKNTVEIMNEVIQLQEERFFFFYIILLFQDCNST